MSVKVLDSYALAAYFRGESGSEIIFIFRACPQIAQITQIFYLTQREKNKFLVFPTKGGQVSS